MGVFNIARAFDGTCFSQSYGGCRSHRRFTDRRHDNELESQRLSYDLLFINPLTASYSYCEAGHAPNSYGMRIGSHWHGRRGPSQVLLLFLHPVLLLHRSTFRMRSLEGGEGTAVNFPQRCCCVRTLLYRRLFQLTLHIATVFPDGSNY